VRTREARLLGAVALGTCLLLACCSGGAATRVPPAGHPPAAPVPVLSTPALAAAPPVRIRISAIGVDSSLIALGLAADGTLQVPVDGSVAGWFTGSPTPGEHGPAVIAAHVDWNHAPGVFFHLRDLEPGAEVAVDRADGTTARFEVLKVEQYPKDAFPTERVYGDIDHAGLRLITCGVRSTGPPAATATTWWCTPASWAGLDRYRGPGTRIRASGPRLHPGITVRRRTCTTSTAFLREKGGRRGGRVVSCPHLDDHVRSGGAALLGDALVQGASGVSGEVEVAVPGPRAEVGPQAAGPQALQLAGGGLGGLAGRVDHLAVGAPRPEVHGSGQLGAGR
jgi:hypothetical protein